MQYQRYLAAREQTHNNILFQARQMVASEDDADAIDTLRDGMVNFLADTRFADGLADAYLSLGRFKDAYQLLVYRAKAAS